MSSLPLSVMVRSCHACATCSGFLSFTLTLRSGSSPLPIDPRFSLCEIFKHAHLKCTVYGRKQASKHTHAHAQCSHASVGLAPNMLCSTVTINNLKGYNRKVKGEPSPPLSVGHSWYANYENYSKHECTTHSLHPTDPAK